MDIYFGIFITKPKVTSSLNKINLRLIDTMNIPEEKEKKSARI